MASVLTIDGTDYDVSGENAAGLSVTKRGCEQRVDHVDVVHRLCADGLFSSQQGR